MAVMVYKNGAWQDAATIQKAPGGVWAEAEGVKRFDGQNWVECAKKRMYMVKSRILVWHRSVELKNSRYFNNQTNNATDAVIDTSKSVLMPDVENKARVIYNTTRGYFKAVLYVDARTLQQICTPYKRIVVDFTMDPNMVAFNSVRYLLHYNRGGENTKDILYGDCLIKSVSGNLFRYCAEVESWEKMAMQSTGTGYDAFHIEFLQREPQNVPYWLCIENLYLEE